jgi:hypothetical protein
MFDLRRRIVKISIRGFEPHTDNDDPIARKTALLNEIKKRIDVEKTAKKCEGKLISLSVVYYLNKNTRILGQYWT